MAQHHIEVANPKYLHSSYTKDSTVKYVFQLRSTVDQCIYYSGYGAVDSTLFVTANKPFNLLTQRLYNSNGHYFFLDSVSTLSFKGAFPFSVALYSNAIQNEDTNLLNVSDFCEVRDASEGTELFNLTKGRNYSIPWFLPPEVFALNSQRSLYPNAAVRVAIYAIDSFLDYDREANHSYLIDSIIETYDNTCDYITNNELNVYDSSVYINTPSQLEKRFSHYDNLWNPSNYERYFKTPELGDKFTSNLVRYNSENGEEFKVITNSFIDHYAIDENFGLNQFYEVVFPEAMAATKYFLPELQPDSVFVNITFLDSNSTLYVDNIQQGIYNPDTTVRLKLFKDTYFRSDKKFQVFTGTYSDTNRASQATVNFRAYQKINHRYLGTGFQLLAPEHFINYTFFKPVLPPDTSTQAFVNLTCRSSATQSMLVNGQPLPSNLWQPFSASPDYSFAEIPLVRDSTYHLENPAGFNGIHYSRPLKREGHVRLYAMTLGEVPRVEKDYGRLQHRKPMDNNWAADDTLWLCRDEKYELRLPQWRFTTVKLSLPAGKDTTINVGKDEAPPLPFSAPKAAGRYMITACDSSGCQPCDTVFLTIDDYKINQVSEQISLSCEGMVASFTLDTQFITDSLLISCNGELLAEGEGNTIDFLIPAKWYQTNPLPLTVEAYSGPCDTVIQYNLYLPEINGILPNVFTPNGDGVSDCFGLDQNLHALACKNLSVYSRNGQLIWQAGTETCWDGTYKGTQAAEGVYFYTLTLGDGSQFKGFVHLMR